jgi:hypothetical protein
MTSYTLQVQPRASYTLEVQPPRQYTIQVSNQRGPQGPAGADGSDASATTDASLLVSGTLAVEVGGTGLNSLGSALQVLRVNAGGTALEYGTVSGGSGNVSNTGTPTAGQIAEWTDATTVQGVSTTGSGNYVRATSPTLVTPALGVATATSLVASGIAKSSTGFIAGTPTTLDSGKLLQIESNFGTGAGSGIKLRNTNASGYTEVVLNNDNNRSDGCFVFGIGGSTAGGVPNEVYLSSRISGIQFYTSNSYRARILANGRFLINTNSDDGGSLLQVNGTAAVTTLAVGGGTGPLLVNASGTIQLRNNANNADASATCLNLTASGTLRVGGGTVVASILSATATLDFGSIGSNGTETLTITVTGAVAGDSVFLGVPAGLDAGLIFCASVTAANTVTVRMHNSSGGSVDPASGTFRATVIRF